MRIPGLFTWWGLIAGAGVLSLPLALPKEVPIAWILWLLGLGFGLLFHARVSLDWPRLQRRQGRTWTGDTYPDLAFAGSGQSYSQRLAGWALVAVLLWLAPFFWLLWAHQGNPPESVYRAFLLGGLAFPGSVFASAGYWGWRTYREKYSQTP